MGRAFVGDHVLRAHSGRPGLLREYAQRNIILARIGRVPQLDHCGHYSPFGRASRGGRGGVRFHNIGARGDSRAQDGLGATPAD